MATEQKFSKSEAVRFGWNTTRSNLGFFIGLLIVVGMIYFIPDFIAELLKKDAPVLSFIVDVVSWILGIIVQMGLIKIALRFCDNKRAKLADLFSCLPLFFKYLFGSILYHLIVLGGTILLIIPGIIWAIKFQFFDYFIIDKGLGPIEALKESSAITRGAKWDLFFFNLLLGFINFLGALCLLIGLFVTVPTAMLAMAFVYRKLLTQKETSQVPELSTEKGI
ncbi:MAG: hypothetical protein DRM99_05030 [Thermoplasmata archaeon]|nr:MAG: hypothetical protein DRM99_05030 [Thermoplasmata archaeon]